MDGAKASHLYPTVVAKLTLAVLMPQRVGRSQGWRRRRLGVNLAGAAPGADLGGSSKYSREALDDRCGEACLECIGNCGAMVVEYWGLMMTRTDLRNGYGFIVLSALAHPSRRVVELT